MTKGELRRIRKENRTQGRVWVPEVSAAGNQMIRVITPKEEREHGVRMERWAAKYADGD